MIVLSRSNRVVAVGYCRLGGVLILLAYASAANAQNLLTNPGLEGLAGYPVPPGSCDGPDGSLLYYRYNCIPEIEPPSWWLPFWNDGPMPPPQTTDYRRPEFRMYGWPDLPDGGGPHFTYDGQWYLVFFGYFGAIDAGIYQQVNVTPGKRYEFSYQGYVWSNCLGGKNPGSGLA